MENRSFREDPFAVTPERSRKAAYWCLALIVYALLANVANILLTRAGDNYLESGNPFIVFRWAWLQYLSPLGTSFSLLMPKFGAVDNRTWVLIGFAVLELLTLLQLGGWLLCRRANPRGALTLRGAAITQLILCVAAWIPVAFLDGPVGLLHFPLAGVVIPLCILRLVKLWRANPDLS